MNFLAHTPSVEELLNPSKRVKCPSEGCPKILYRPAVVKHLKREHGYDPTLIKILYFCPVPNCDRSKLGNSVTRPFETIGSIRQHYKVVHSRDNTGYTCNKCEKKFKSRYYVYQHKFACGEAYICSCNEVFTCMKGLRRHALENKHQIPLSSKLKNVPPNVLPATLIKVKQKNKSSRYKYILPKRINRRSYLHGTALPSKLEVLQKSVTDESGEDNFNDPNQLQPGTTSHIQNYVGSRKKPTLPADGQTYLNMEDWLASNEKKCENNATQTLFLDDVTDECCVDKDNLLNVNFNNTKDFAIQTNLAMENWENSTQTDIGLVEDMPQQWYSNKIISQVDPFSTQYPAAACSKDFAGQTNCDYEPWLSGAEKDISDNTTQTVISQLDEMMFKDLSAENFATEELPHQHSEKPTQIDLKDFASQTANGEDVWLQIPETYLVNHGTQTLIPNSGQIETVSNFSQVDLNETHILMDQQETDLQRFFNKSLPKFVKASSLNDRNLSQANNDDSVMNSSSDGTIYPNMLRPNDPSMFLCTGSQTEEKLYNDVHDGKTAAASNFDELFCHIETQTDCDLNWQDNLTNSCTQTMMTDDKSMYEMLDIQTQTDCNLWSFD